MSTSELDMLEAQLTERLRETYDGKSLPRVGIAHLQAFAQRLRVLAVGEDSRRANALRESAERGVDALQGVSDPPGSTSGSPTWGEAEACMSDWLEANWKCAPLRIGKTESGSPSLVDGVRWYAVRVTAWVVTAKDAHPVNLHAKLSLREDGWFVEYLAVS